MQAIECIDTDIPFLKDTDTVSFALDLMAGNGYADLPVVGDRRYLGTISEDVLLNLEDDSLLIGSLRLEHQETFISEREHIFELIKRMINKNLFVMPVLTIEEEFAGMANARSIVKKLGENSSLMETGGLIVLELNKSDYSLTEISRIVESNDALILNCFISSRENLSLIEVTLKINRTDLEDIIQSFERFEYTVKAAYHESTHQEDLQHRYDSLMHYLNM